MSEPLTVALCDDSGIFRQGVAMLLEASGIVVRYRFASANPVTIPVTADTVLAPSGRNAPQ